MYTKSARLYDVMYAGKDYAAASRFVHNAIGAVRPEAATLLDVACGTGRHLEHLRASYDVEGLDLSSDLLEMARARCPGVPLHQADMTSFSLPRRFDAVTCLFSAVAYLKTADRLTSAIERMASHLTDDGVLLV